MQLQDGGKALLTKWPCSCLFLSARIRSRLLTAFLIPVLLAFVPVQAGAEFIDNTAFLDSDQVSKSAFVRIDVEEPPPPTVIQLGNLSFPENAAGVSIGELTLSGLAPDPDFTLSDDRFEIVNDTLRLKPGIAFDFESESSVVLTVEATGLDSTRFSTTFSITVLDVNEEPFDLAIDNNFLPAGESGGIVGELRVDDEDQGDEHVFQVVGDDRFIIVDGILSLVENTVLDENVDIPLTIQATDKGGLSTRQVILVTSNPDNVNIEPSPSVVRFLQYGSSGRPVDLEAESCSSASRPDSRSPEPTSARGIFDLFRFPGTQKLDVADTYAIGDPVFVSVVDADQNIDPRRIDTVTVTVSVDTTGDSEVLTLFESDVDTGEFFGFVLSTGQPGEVNDCQLSVTVDTELSALYVDARDQSDIANAQADVALLGLVFDDETGEPIDDIILVLTEVSSDAPAEVRGDGPEYGLYPSAVKTGGEVRDTAGKTYIFEPGEYRFPAVPEGDYRIEIFNDIAFRFSDKPDEEIRENLAQAASQRGVRSDRGLVLVPASRGAIFHVRQGAIPRIDIPLQRVAREVEPTPSNIEFLQYSPRPGVGEPVNVEETFCIGSETRQAVELRDVLVPVPGVVNLLPATTFKAGQPVFIRVTDLDQNKDPDVRERIMIEVNVPVLNETEFLELTETQPDSGVFVGYVQTTENETVQDDCELTVVKNEEITTVYTDSFDRTDTSASLVLVDPFGVIFNTSTGEPVDGVTVSLVDADTGEPATVFGDGPAFAAYPATIVSGGSVTDAAGVEYNFPPGEYRFPFVEAGFYRLVISGLPEGFLFPSTATSEEIQALPNAPYSIQEGSFGERFEVPLGPALHIDIPVDKPDNIVVLTKTVSRTVASIGEFVQYRVRVANTQGGLARDITVTDTLPPGLRFQSGSLRIDNEKAADPAIDPSGSVLTLQLDSVEGSGSVDISYVAEITAGTPVGKAVNRVRVSGDSIVEANTAEAEIFVTEDLLRSKAILTGKVLYGECDDPEAEGVSNALVYLEDGTGVLTDLDGNWHIEGVTPGTHVVQLDLDSLEDRYQVAECNTRENRNSGRAYSQFVDVRGGTVWRTNFHIVDRPPPQAEVVLEQRLVRENDQVRVNMGIDLEDTVPLYDASVFYRAPVGWKIVEGSAQLNDVAVNPEVTIIGNRFHLATSGDQTLTFLIEPRETAPQPVKADTRVPDKVILRPAFATRSATLDDAGEKRILAALAPYRGMEVTSIRVTGYSDNIPIAPANRAQYADNYVLSRARAETVAATIGTYLGLDPSRIEIRGAGPENPVASNRTAAGRAANRRVEVELDVLAPGGEEWLTLRPVFKTRKATLPAEELEKIRTTLAPHRDQDIAGVVVTGHSDSVPIAPRNRKEFRDNYELSLARAQTVARVVGEVLGLPADRIQVVGSGPDLPVADNRTSAGRALNRRVEIRLLPSLAEEAPVIEPTDPFISDEPLLSKATLRFNSLPGRAGRGKTKTSEMDIRNLSGTEELFGRVSGIATGSWDKPDGEAGSSGSSGEEVPEGIVSLTEGELINTEIQGVRVKLRSDLLPRLVVDGNEVSRDKIGITIERSDGTTLYTYVGVDFGKDAGERHIVLEGLDKFGEKQYEDSRTVVRTGRIEFIRLSDVPGNIADGKTPVSIKVDLLDGNMRTVKTNAQLQVVEGQLIPYTSEADIRSGTFKTGKVEVSSSGIAKFAPVAKAGYYRVVLAYEEFRDDITIQVKPETREWVMVGLGEGLIGYNNIKGNLKALDARQLEDGFYQEGRLAFFAKGMIKGEWLTTLSWDSDRVREGRLFSRINAGQYYTVYGDTSSQRYDAPTQEKLYVRVENDALNASFGDFATDLSRLELSQYNRRMTGLRVEYVGDRFGATVFAAETTQAFIRDDIQGNGTSGVYKLSTDGIIENSEKISFEIRDRFRNEVVVDESPKTRDFDYSIDYERGELIFKQPVFSQDLDGNPLFIVVKYEIDTSGREKLNVGGRLAMAFNEGKGIVGTTVIRENVQGREAELTGVDFTYRFDQDTELIAEYVTTEQQTGTEKRTGDAYSIQVKRQSPRLDGRAYIREEEAGFGIGQTSAAGKGTRQIGADATVRLNERVSVNAQVYRDESLEDGRTRDVISSTADFRSDLVTYGVGMQAARDSGGGLEKAQSQLVTGKIQTRMLDRKLTLRASGEAPVGAGDNEAFPTLLQLGAEYALNENISLTGVQEFSWGDNKDTRRTVAGVRTGLWKGANLSTTVTQEQGEEGRRMFANYGLLQSVQYNDALSFDFGVDRSQTIKEVANVKDTVNPNARPVFGNADGDFTAMFAGANYTKGPWRYVSRLEYRNAEDDQYNLSVGAMRNLEGGIVLASIFDGRIVRGQQGKTSDNVLSMGLAWRPEDSPWTLFNRLELAVREQSGGDFNTASRKIVNNMNANYLWDEKTQIAMQYAFKYVLDTIDSEEYKGFTDLIGAEVRRNLSQKWDIGLSASVLHSWNSDVMDYSWGLSVGRQFATNTWVSVGYNFDGFRDSDFDDADYTAKGVYLKFRFKFDQDSARQIFREKNVFRKKP